MRLALGIEYNGAPYHGWQRQQTVASVQQHVEVLSLQLRRPLHFVQLLLGAMGCGP